MIGSNTVLKNFLFLVSIFFSIAFAQDQTQSDILSILVSILSIGIVVLILLYLGGVLKLGGARISLAPIFYTLLIVIIFVLPLLQKLGFIKIFPDTISSEDLKRWGFPQNNKIPEPVCKIFKSLTLQEEIACYIPEIIFLFILPFAAIFAITWAFLKMLNIFEGVANADNIYRLLAFIIAFMTIPMGIFIILIAFWFSFMGAFSVAIFVAMFIAGAFFRGYGYITGEYYKIKKSITAELSKRLSDAITEIAQIETFAETNPNEAINRLDKFYYRYRDDFQLGELSPRKLGEIRGITDIDKKKEELRKLIESVKNALGNIKL